MNKALATIALAVTLVSLGSTSAFANHGKIAEDEPGWNCHTMGNKICGPVLGAKLGSALGALVAAEQ